MLVNTKKIAGILIENQILGSYLSNSVIGIGLNLNQQNFEGLNATSLAIETATSLNLNTVLAFLLERLEIHYLALKRGNVEVQKELYLNNLYGFKQSLLFEDSTGKFEGVITGIDAIGRLIVIKGTEEQVYNFKEIRFLL